MSLKSITNNQAYTGKWNRNSPPLVGFHSSSSHKARKGSHREPCLASICRFQRVEWLLRLKSTLLEWRSSSPPGPVPTSKSQVSGLAQPGQLDAVRAAGAECTGTSSLCLLNPGSMQHHLIKKSKRFVNIVSPFQIKPSKDFLLGKILSKIKKKASSTSFFLQK